MSPQQKKSKWQIFTNGIIKENPVLVLILGICPALAVTTSAFNGIGMGMTTLVVLLCSNIVISILKRAIPDKVRIPCYIVVISGFVTVVGFVLQAYLPELNQSLGLFIPLIVVNCIVLGRAEMFASKNSVGNSALDGLGMGLGFTLALFLMGSVRELIGNGTWFDLPVLSNISGLEPMSIFILAPGAFFVFGCLVALINHLSKGRAIKKKEFGCENCQNAAGCQQAGEGGCDK